jgi:hypothetical protein
MLWHDQLGHPGSIIMRRIIENSHGHPLKNLKIPLPKEKLGKDPIGSPPFKIGRESFLSSGSSSYTK